MNIFVASLMVILQFSANIMAEDDCTIIPIAKWGGQPSRRNEILETPVKIVVIQHTMSQPCHTDRYCAYVLRGIRNYHTYDLCFDDIGPSFLVSGHGKVYEGAGWSRVGAHTKGYNKRSVAISFIGDFTYLLPSPEALEAAQHLLDCGMKNKYLAEDYELVGHRQLSHTTSPGDRLQKNIETWPHWSEELE